jgi:hypothetical protein
MSEINYDEIRGKVYRRYRRLERIGWHILLIVGVVVVGSAFNSELFAYIFIFFFLALPVHILYALMLNARDREVERAIERERRYHYETLHQRPKPKREDAHYRLSDDGEIIEYLDDDEYYTDQQAR